MNKDRTFWAIWGIGVIVIVGSVAGFWITEIPFYLIAEGVGIVLCFAAGPIANKRK